MAYESEYFRSAGLACKEGDFVATLAELPPALATGNPLLDDEHRMLLGIMRKLRGLCIDLSGMEHCNACQQARRSSCEKDLVGLLGDLFAFILEHFSSEEKIMRQSMMRLTERAWCDAHVEDHAAIAQKVQEIVARLNEQQTVQRLRELDTLLSRWLENHVGLHDRMLVRWLNGEVLSAAPVQQR